MSPDYNAFKTATPTGKKKIYVKVTTDFDSTGYMSPRTIIWHDGRTFQIDEVRDFKPAANPESAFRKDCYTIVIKGKEKHLFFERSDSDFRSRIGRWFVEGE